jgi:porphobilinogen synthase
MQYIECLFINDNIERTGPSPLADVCQFEPLGVMDHVAKRVEQGIHHFLLFGVPRVKSIASGVEPASGVARVLRRLKDRHGTSVSLFADVGLSPYREDGHSVVMSEGGVDLGQSYSDAAKLAVAFAKSGADYVAPCLSLPDQIAEIRLALEDAGQSTKIMGYSAKFSSALYGPYRSAISSSLGDHLKSYQTDAQDPQYALEQVKRDEEQGASIVMVKPGSFYLDVLVQAKQVTSLPVAVFHVSGEYMMIKRAAELDGMNEADAFDEIHRAFHRCGADYVIGYAPDHFRRWAR